MKPIILNIIDHPPAYAQLGNRGRPSASWDVPGDSWVGIWGYDWADLVGHNLLAVTDEFEYEVLQPDFRADRAYCTRLESGVVHRLFPAASRSRWYGLKRVSYPHCPELLAHLSLAVQRGPAIVHLPDVTHPLSLEFLSALHPCRVICQNLGIMTFPLQLFWTPQKNLLAKIANLRDHGQIRCLGPRVARYLHPWGAVRNSLMYFPQARQEFACMGLDGALWKPTGLRNAVRTRLGVSPRTRLLVCGSPLRPPKQVDRFIQAAKTIKVHRPWAIIIAGTGDPQYVEWLKAQCGTLLEEKRIRFTGFISDEELRDLYEAADLFVNPSLREGGPMAAIKALAMGLPVFTTDSGLVAAWVKENGCGSVVPPASYGSWPRVLTELIDSDDIRKPDAAKVRERFEWKNVALNYARIYREVLNEEIPDGW